MIDPLDWAHQHSILHNMSVVHPFLLTGVHEMVHLLRFCCLHAPQEQPESPLSFQPPLLGRLLGPLACAASKAGRLLDYTFICRSIHCTVAAQASIAAGSSGGAESYTGLHEMLSTVVQLPIAMVGNA